MTEEELRDFEKFADQIAVMSSPSIAAGMRRLIAEVRRLRVGDKHMAANGTLHVVCCCEKCVISPQPAPTPATQSV